MLFLWSWKLYWSVFCKPIVACKSCPFSPKVRFFPLYCWPFVWGNSYGWNLHFLFFIVLNFQKKLLTTWYCIIPMWTVWPWKDALWMHYLTQQSKIYPAFYYFKNKDVTPCLYIYWLSVDSRVKDRIHTMLHWGNVCRW